MLILRQCWVRIGTVREGSQVGVITVVKVDEVRDGLSSGVWSYIPIAWKATYRESRTWPVREFMVKLSG